ncbi:MAG: hypothetical protein KGI75_13275, partial [Rhizobiaceae bacterium]|nr:hypothetical protein [Rhizobiaceae bacterium]
MRMILASLCLLYATAPAVAGSGHFYSGNNLQELCAAKSPSVRAFIAGWLDKQSDDADSVAVFRSSYPSSNQLRKLNALVAGNTCLPSQVTLGQTQDVLCQYLDRNPAQRAEPASTLVGFAF